jgi:predicted DNA-binding transcriptional regulator AlpA
MATSPNGLTAQEVADRLGVHPITLWRWMDAGIGPPSFKLVGRRYWPEAEFEQWFREQRTLQPAGADS